MTYTVKPIRMTVNSIILLGDSRYAYWNNDKVDVGHGDPIEPLEKPYALRDHIGVDEGLIFLAPDSRLWVATHDGNIIRLPKVLQSGGKIIIKDTDHGLNDA